MFKEFDIFRMQSAEKSNCQKKRLKPKEQIEVK